MPFKQAILMFHQFRSSFHNVLPGRADDSGFIDIVAVSFMFVSCSVQTSVCLVETRVSLALPPFYLMAVSYLVTGAWITR